VDRRRFLRAVTASVLSVPLAAEAQQTAAIPYIGILFPTSLSDPRTAQFLDAFREGLRELGYADGQNVATVSRFADEQWGRLPGLASDLVRAKVDIILTYTTPATLAAKHATTTRPIVFAAVIDPVAAGLVASLAHPGSNVTGLSQMVPELVGKQLEILKEAAPNVSRVALLENPVKSGECAPAATRSGCGSGIGHPRPASGGAWSRRHRECLRSNSQRARRRRGCAHRFNADRRAKTNR